MTEVGSPLAGEMSGHIFFADKWYGFDDGLYALLRVLELAHQQGPLVAQFAELPSVHALPAKRIACADKRAAVAAAEKIASTWVGARLITTDGVRVEWENGWILVRAANTEPVLSVRCEGSDAAALTQMQQRLTTLLAPPC